ncbi:hypothetical protein NXF25_009875 [Crotalus adamanteus]|uniref:Uncharacterized protein n=1 Tax=Crotalus adamanteus TaxID=8729 RepID=A0AAW1BU90_CROAD
MSSGGLLLLLGLLSLWAELTPVSSQDRPRVPKAINIPNIPNTLNVRNVLARMTGHVLGGRSVAVMDSWLSARIPPRGSLVGPARCHFTIGRMLQTHPIPAAAGHCVEEDGPPTSLVRKPEGPRQGGLLAGGEERTEPLAHFGPAHPLDRPVLVLAQSEQPGGGAENFIMSSGGLLLLLGLLSLWAELTPVSSQDRPHATFLVSTTTRLQTDVENLFTVDAKAMPTILRPGMNVATPVLRNLSALGSSILQKNVGGVPKAINIPNILNILNVRNVLARMTGHVLGGRSVSTSSWYMQISVGSFSLLHLQALLSSIKVGAESEQPGGGAENFIMSSGGLLLLLGLLSLWAELTPVSSQDRPHATFLVSTTTRLQTDVENLFTVDAKAMPTILRPGMNVATPVLRNLSALGSSILQKNVGGVPKAINIPNILNILNVRNVLARMTGHVLGGRSVSTSSWYMQISVGSFSLLHLQALLSSIKVGAEVSTIGRMLQTHPIPAAAGHCVEEDGPPTSLVRKPEGPRQGGLLAGGEERTEPLAHFGPAHPLDRPVLVLAQVTGSIPNEETPLNWV